MGFPELWIDLTFKPGMVEWLLSGGVILSLEDWLSIMNRIHVSDKELEPYLRDTHTNW